MKRIFGDAQYTSYFVEDLKQGFAGYELLRSRGGKEEHVATVLFWDAMGHFFVETFGDVPVVVLEELIAEARSGVNVK